MIVQKKTFELPSFQTQSGRLIKNLCVGWESYGTLNADKSNAILIAHYFSGTSHAAGKYAEEDALPGYWDDLIGPGKAIDTDRYFVFSSDTLVNLNARDKNVVTTGPASLDPDTGKPYGLSFPLVSIRDFVGVQKELVDHLGIKKLHAVMGPSMGGLQTLCWASSFPDMMERIVPVICAGVIDAWLTAWLGLWAAPIYADPAWKNGAYAPDAQPVKGLTLALRLVTLQANHWLWADAQFGRAFAVEGADPGADLANRFKVEAAIADLAAARAAVSDANHLLYLVKANQTFSADLAAIKARTLLLYTPTDQVFRQEHVLATAAAIVQGHAIVETAEILGPYGHLNGLAALAPLGAKIAEFLAR
ncbi:E22 family MetX-like putative esterase [Methyloferula stellata]|uniref:E22 family MetX-like putative esterase n=1 Tax=Methyloferula stellata TaxID=876270 RepID=UPI0003680E96